MRLGIRLEGLIKSTKNVNQRSVYMGSLVGGVHLLYKSEAAPSASLQTGWLTCHMDPFVSLPSARPAQWLLKERKKGREYEEEDVSSYWTCLKTAWHGGFRASTPVVSGALTPYGCYGEYCYLLPSRHKLN